VEEQSQLVVVADLNQRPALDQLEEINLKVEIHWLELQHQLAAEVVAHLTSREGLEAPEVVEL
jgi:signal recognition particle GTPase